MKKLQVLEQLHFVTRILVKKMQVVLTEYLLCTGYSAKHFL